MTNLARLDRWLKELETPLRNGSQVVVRHLFYGIKPGMLICLFRDHRAPMARSQAYPARANFPAYSVPGDPSRIFGLTYILSGSGVVRYGTRRYAVNAGDFVQINGAPSSQFQLTSTGDLRECSVCVDTFTADRLAERQIWDARVEHGHIGRQPRILRRYHELFQSIRNAAVDSGTLLRAFTALLQEVYALHSSSSADLRFVQQARTALAEESGPQLSVTHVASQFRMSYSLFRRKFQRLTGTSPRAFQLRVRMDRACELLINHSVKQTAALLGYSDPFVFSRQFKQHVGAPPSEMASRK
jgi:AraC-like DNA-binding protein